MASYVTLPTAIPNIHHLKTWPEYFEEILSGRKTFELRLNDRDFNVGDILILKKYDPETESYLCSEMTFNIDYILKGDMPGLVPGYCIMSISRIDVTITKKKVKKNNEKK